VTYAKVSNSVKETTENLGQTIATEERQVIEAAWNPRKPVLPEPPTRVPERLYVSIDGTAVHTHEEQWKEMKLGAFYTTTVVASQKRPEKLAVHAQGISYYADFADPESFGKALWLEGYRRGAAQAKEVVAVGDGAHWIWNLVEEHFPGAIQIVDWYHATEYIWNVAHAVHGEGTELAKAWAKDRLDELWNGKVDSVLTWLYGYEGQGLGGEAVQTAITYYTNNKDRMRYPDRQWLH
jgi:hypothetical protein